MIKNPAFRLFAAACALSLVTGCAGLGLGGSPEDIVRKRANDRIDALMVGDFEKSFTYVAPALRAVTNWKDHALRQAGVRNWISAAVTEVECDESRCSVEVLVTYQMPRFKAKNTRPLKEVWIAVDGRWYLYYD
ncbi:MAG: hypothetical protein HKN19_02945 [Halioglobus sp.]|nr:hypothetical protein [Halioglobus sp.]